MSNYRECVRCGWIAPPSKGPVERCPECGGQMSRGSDAERLQKEEREGEDHA